MQDIQQYLQEHQDRFEQELCDLLRIPSISADRRRQPEMRTAARWLADRFTALGLACQCLETAGPPLVYAESPPVPGAPTVLVYGHYDVQPVEPLDRWESPPFEPVVRTGNVYARGATDDKGQMLTHVLSTEAWLRTRGGLPLQLKFLIEGEEEVGSEGLNQFLPGAGRQLACDVVVISDTSQFGPGRPAITYGLRGIVGFELRVRGARRDLHSGSFGGAVANPLNALARMIAGLIDARGRITVPGFYDGVLPLSAEERRQMAALTFDEAAFQRELGVNGLSGEEGYTTLERRWARPTFDVHGIWGGYQGEGSKTVLPCEAGVKFSFRLVPRQDPRGVAPALRRRLEELCPPGIRWELIEMHGAPGVVVPLDSPYLKAAARAIEHGFGAAPVFIREGGSIPIVTAFREQLGVDTLLLGWGLDDDNAHAPNEKFSLADFHRGIQTSALLWQELSVISR